jgi:hypothetical protein
MTSRRSTSRPSARLSARPPLAVRPILTDFDRFLPPPSARPAPPSPLSGTHATPLPDFPCRVKSADGSRTVTVEVFDSTEDHVKVLQECFDFDAIKARLARGTRGAPRWLAGWGCSPRLAVFDHPSRLTAAAPCPGRRSSRVRTSRSATTPCRACRSSRPLSHCHPRPRPSPLRHCHPRPRPSLGAIFIRPRARTL